MGLTIMKRLGILAYKGSGTRVYGSVPALVEELGKELDRVVIVCEEKAEDAVATALCGHVDQVIPCTKPLMDMYAYRHAVRALGVDEMAEFDEVVFFSDSIFGPLESVRAVFAKMDERDDLDFWGITRCGVTTLGRHSVCPYKERPEHLQLYFFAVRRHMVQSPHFSAFFSDMPSYKRQQDVRDGIEAVFTPYFVARGFSWDTFVQDDGLVSTEAAYNNDVSVVDPYELVAHRSMPFVRKESFLTSRTEYLTYGTQNAVHDVLDYVHNKTSYDVGLIYEWLLSEVGLWQVEQAVGELEIIPDSRLVGKDDGDSVRDMAVVALLEDPGTVSYLAGLPSEVALYVVADGLTIEDLNAVHEGSNTVICRREQSADTCFVSVCQEYGINSRYEYVCAVFDEKQDEREFVTLDDRYREHVFSNLLGSPELIRNIRHEFTAHPELGVLGVSSPNIGSYFGDLRMRTWQEAPGLRDCLAKMGCHVPWSKLELLVKPLASFWCSTRLLNVCECMLQKGRQNEVAAWLKSALPYVAQSKGCLTKRILAPHAVEAEVVAQEYMLAPPVRMLNRIRHIHADSTFARFIGDVKNYVSIPRLTPQFYAPTSGNNESPLSELPKGAEEIHGKIYGFLSLPRFNEYMNGAWKKNKRLATVFSSARINAIEWLPVELDHTVVEIGGSYGEYTNVLARRSSSVYTYEPNDVRRAIIAKRCERLSNVRLFGSLVELQEALQDKVVDWLVIHDLEGSFAVKADVEHTLVEVTARLRPKRMVLLCNNAHGIRYATESWLVEKAEINADARKVDLRFSRGELRTLFERAGFSRFSFYYPHPDYIFTKTIFSDDRIPTPGSIKANQVWRLSGQRLQDEEEREALVSIVENGEFVDKCNSYLVIAEQEGIGTLDRLPLYVRFPSDRKVQHSLRTEIYGNGDVRKTCMYISGRGHIHTAKVYTPVLREMYQRAGIVFDHIDYSTNGMRYTFIEGTDLQSVLVDMVNKGNLEEFEQVLGTYIESIVASHDDGYFAPSVEFSNVFGNAVIRAHERCVSISNIDLNVDNIIVSSDGTYHIIDCEWIFDFPIPVSYIVWRIIYFFFSRFSFDDNMNKLQNQFYKRFNIDEEQWETYRKMESSFQRYMGL